MKQAITERGWGPCLGVYSSLDSQGDRPFGEQTNLFRDLVHLGAQKGVDVVILTPGYVRTQQGWRYDQELKRWVLKPIRQPDVIIRRSGTFSPQSLPQVVQDLNSFKSEGKLHTLPRVCGNKWSLYQVMKSDPELARRFPQTVLARSAREVYRLVQQKGDVYIKPVAGAQGVQVYHLFLQGNKVVASWEKKVRSPFDEEKLRGNFETYVVSESFARLDAFERFWQQTRLRQCLVQDTVVLPRTADNEPFDLRWLVQNCQDYTVVARVARIGRHGSVTTNIHTGAKAMAAENVLATAGGLDSESVLQELDQVALRVARHLETKYGRFAEVGIDMAVQSDGRVFVFEANPTPGRRMLRSLGGDVRKLSLMCLVEYAMRATGLELESM